jgi:hypothetical protein
MLGCVIGNDREVGHVDLSVKLNVLAVFASFMLIGAILLGAF